MSTAIDTLSTRDQDYFDSPGLSNSGMTDLAVSPLRYWYLHLSPEKPADEPTPAMIFGSALHCAVLEGDEALDSRYACEFNKDDFPDALGTVEHIRSWVREKGGEPKGTKKVDVIASARMIDKDVLILDELEARHFAMTQGRQLLTIEQWTRLAGCVQALKNEPRLQQILGDKDGRCEVPASVIDPETGVLLKAKMDWVTPRLTMDVKTFVQKRGKSIDQSITDAIWYENYFRQGFVYTNIRDIAEGHINNRPWGRDYVMAFVESEPPHEVRLRALRPSMGGQPNLYWLTARNTVQELTRLYADCVEKFGYETPWRTSREIDPLVDDEIKQLAWI